MDAATVIALVVGSGGIGTLLMALLRYNREDASAVVDQTTKLITAMREMLDEVEEALERCRKDRDRYRHELAELRRKDRS